MSYFCVFKRSLLGVKICLSHARRSSLGVKFKISDEVPRLFHMGVPPPPGGFILQDKTRHALRLFSINQPSYKNKAILTNPLESPILFCRLQAFGENMGRRDKSEMEHCKSERGKRERGMRERERRHSARRNLWCRGTNQMVSERPEENCNIPAENTFSRALNSRDSR